jgi:hypothetical protein
MGLFDKVKQQAEKAKVQAQDLKGKVGEKVDEVQGKRKADDLLDDLGRFLYAERTGRPLPGADGEIERIVDELKALEDGGITILPAPAPQAPQAPAAPPAPPEPPAAEAPAPPVVTADEPPPDTAGPEATGPPPLPEVPPTLPA